MFSGKTSFNQPIDQLNTDSVTNTNNMFEGASAMTYQVSKTNKTNYFHGLNKNKIKDK